mgnify:FL=1|jgi:uncharacterized coiled-coil DUF342 family protein
MRIEDLKNWTVDQLKEEVVRLADESEAKQHEILNKNKKINELQDKLDNMRAYNNELKRQVDEKADTPFYDESIEIAKYHRRHESDCITINQLQTALDVLVDRYATLRKIHGVSLYGGEK